MSDEQHQHDVTGLATELVRRRSITPDDAGCQAVIAERLAGAGFSTESLRFGEVDNLWARHGTGAPLVVLAGHTDVVPTGPEERWSEPPFAGNVRDGMLYGRGAADMKGSVAAMAVAAERFVRAHPRHAGSVALLITSDEEGPAVDGTRRVVEALAGRGEDIDYCLVGEPSSVERFGDTVKIGRRGSLTGYLSVHGVQGHVAYPGRGRNPVHELVPALAELLAERWDEGNAHFPPTSFQVSNVHAGTGADNVIPGHADVVFNFRYSTESTAEGLGHRVTGILDRHGLEYEVQWRNGGHPFLTEPGVLTDAICDAVESVVGHRPALATTGGTSDARYIAPMGTPVVELGPLNATIHQIDERIALDDLERMARVTQLLLERLLVA
ncbi:MAG: succinyl-diaminopimelate desuccinylase [Halofilum sp. (in: g-proteobacteria)]|nr:succinyl-diaminopimelate desuccinylase [Halofilum sp. (in: g-proteobacteria)]